MQRLSAETTEITNDFKLYYIPRQEKTVSDQGTMNVDSDTNIAFVLTAVIIFIYSYITSKAKAYIYINALDRQNNLLLCVHICQGIFDEFTAVHGDVLQRFSRVLEHGEEKRNQGSLL